MEPSLQRFLDAFHADRDAVAALFAQVIDGLDWEDPLGEVDGVEPAELLLCSTFGETVAESVELQVGRYTLRYPGPVQHRAAGLQLVDAMNGLQATLHDLLDAVRPLDDEVCRALGLTAAKALQPDGRFRWTDHGLAQAYEVVEAVQRWPGQIQLEAARRRDPELQIGDQLWLEGREQVPVVWALDWLRR